MGKKHNNDPWNTINTDCHKLYTDEQIDKILSYLPTNENCVILGKHFKRSKGTIANIYRIARTPLSRLKENYGKQYNDNKFVNQIYKISKRKGWIKGLAPLAKKND